jgi:hypothetical protein
MKQIFESDLFDNFTKHLENGFYFDLSITSLQKIPLFELLIYSGQQIPL